MNQTKCFLRIIMPIVAIICAVVFVPWDVVWLWSTGLLPGYSSIARYDKDIDTVVVLFVNTSGGELLDEI